jgi:hypothetical protein
MKLVSFENRTEEERVQAAWGTGTKYMHKIEKQAYQLAAKG